MHTVVEAQNLHKSHGHGTAVVNAVQGVSLSISAGEIVSIVGPSGSGKSTLLNLLGGLDRPDSGEVIIAGHKLSTLDDNGLSRLRREKVGFIFQFFNLLPLLTARENVTLPLLLNGVPRKAAEIRADELLERVDIARRSHHMPDEMSGGEMQRVAVARALGSRPAVLLADEPTGNLDSTATAAVLDLLRSAARENGCGLIIVTHDARAAEAADRLLEFKDGRLARERFQSARPRSAGPRKTAEGA
jgi:putative ABC transport system ATP-binding protein